MALWYRTGTIAVTNGSATVTGTGTSWVDAQINPGDALHAPDGRVYEVASVASATAITLVSTYLGSTASAQAYAIQPTRAVTADWRASAQALVDAYAGYAAGPLAGKWPAGTAALPSFAGASDLDTGLYFPAANQLAAATGGVLRWLLSTTAFQVSVPITGTAVTQSATDTTAARLLKVGDYGAGAAAGTVLFGRANILGTVSQASGVPTGAVVERGSNGNGEYVRFADGTQMCWRSGAAIDCTVVQGVLWMNTSLQSWTFPAAFSVAPAVHGSPGTTSRFTALGVPSATVVSYRILSPFTDANTYAPTLAAIGRWF